MIPSFIKELCEEAWFQSSHGQEAGGSCVTEHP